MKKKKIFKKKLEDFLKDESGNISRDKIVKIGLGTISALGMMSAFSSADTHYSHENSIDKIAQHCSHVSHSSY